MITQPDLKILDLRRGYVDLVNEVIEHGKRVAPRGQGTREVLNATIELADPRDALPVGIGRKPNLAIGAGEALQLIGGFSDPEMMVSIAGSFERFMDGGVLQGAYGPRIRVGLPHAITRLIEDPDTRQSIVQVARPEDFIGVPSRDLPCTKDLHFFVRDNKLSLVTSMRSNDVWLGVAYDFFQFTQLQLSVATSLGLKVGPYYHHADSLHIYDRNIEAAEELHYPDPRGPEETGHPTGIGNRPVEGTFFKQPVEQMQRRAVELWEGKAPLLEGVTASECWYIQQLAGHTRTYRKEKVQRGFSF